METGTHNSYTETRKRSDCIKNYRPISLLDFLGKIYERLILARIQRYLNNPNNLHHAQFGFKPHHSTREAIHRLTSHIQNGFQRKQHTIAAFLDIEQAFDTVWHDGLLYKLDNIHIPSSYIKLIHSYLQNRTFQVRDGPLISDFHPIKAGVPQGAVLSPSLFSVYVQDIPTHPKCQQGLYADDTVIYTQHVNIHFGCLQLQEALDSITQWSTKWRLKINGSKSQAIVFTKRFPHRTDSLSIQEQDIPFVTTTKYLGIFLDKRLTYRQHITSVRDRAFQRFMALYPVFKTSTSLKIKTLLYTTLLRSYMLYCCEIWSQAHPRHLQRLDGLQRAICRTITGADYRIRNAQLFEMLGDNAGEMSPGSSTESYPAFARIGLRENPGKNVNQGEEREEEDKKNSWRREKTKRRREEEGERREGKVMEKKREKEKGKGRDKRREGKGEVNGREKGTKGEGKREGREEEKGKAKEGEKRRDGKGREKETKTSSEGEREGKGKGREGKGREGKGREGKGREGKGREGKGKEEGKEWEGMREGNREGKEWEKRRRGKVRRKRKGNGKENGKGREVRLSTLHSGITRYPGRRVTEQRSSCRQAQTQDCEARKHISRVSNAADRTLLQPSKPDERMCELRKAQLF
ncbi:hypothetical protein ANN_17986 [Periplaneta americana]|uniref:Reverse transcriptase domain-containing protein n=1 Tax=Periplaneta americana TaxID=6978 RepID=A0ABQ8SMI1_PERAM|nr:hypothetical protein ANN_17986 [Periplaneta americana]